MAFVDAVFKKKQEERWTTFIKAARFYKREKCDSRGDRYTYFSRHGQNIGSLYRPFLADEQTIEQFNLLDEQTSPVAKQVFKKEKPVLVNRKQMSCADKEILDKVAYIKKMKKALPGNSYSWMDDFIKQHPGHFK